MAKPWEELVQEDTFQRLNDEQKEVVRNNYFAMEIEPNIPEGYDSALVRQNFDNQTKTTDLEYRQKKYTEEHGVFERMGMQLKAGLRETSASAAASGLANIEDQLAELEETEQDIKDWEAGKPYHPESYEAQLDPDVARKVMMDKRERVAKKREQLETRKRQAIHRMQWQSKAAREIPQEPVAEAVAQSKTLDEAMEKLSVAPGGAVLGLGFRSAPNMILPMVTAAVFKVPFAGARTITAMKAGKEVVETVKHPLGPIAFALGMGAGSFTVERGAALQEGIIKKLQAKGVDIKDEKAIYDAIGEPEFFNELKQDANMRSAYIAMMDLVGGAALTKNLMPDSLRRGLAKEMLEVTAQMPIQAGTEMLGELTAQYAVDGEIRAGEVLAEGIGSLVTTPGEYATAVLTGVREGQEQRLADMVDKDEALKKRRDELNAKAEEYRSAQEEGATDLEMEARRDELVEDTTNYMNDVNSAWAKFEEEERMIKGLEEDLAYTEKTAAMRERELETAGLAEPAPAMAPKPAEPTPATEPAITKAIEREVAKREKTAELVPTPTQEGPMQKAMREAMEKKKSEIEQAAAAVETEPTEAQKEAGTYKKGHVSLQGLPIAIETPKGANRTGKDEDGNEWSTQLQDHYGYVKRTEGADGDHVDVFVSDNAEAADRVFVVNQNDPNTGQFDEHKVVIGPTTPEEAQQVYQRNYDEGWNGFDSAVEMTIPEFKAWLKTDTNKPVQQADVAALPTKPAMAARGEAVAEPKLRRGAKKKAPGLYTYNGYEIERMESGQWNMRPEGTDTWTDAAATLAEAQTMVDRFTEQEAAAKPKLSRKKPAPKKEPVKLEVPKPEEKRPIVVMGRVEKEAATVFDVSKEPSAKALGGIFGSPKPRKGKEKLDENVKPVAYKTLKKYLDWAIKNDHDGDWYRQFGTGMAEIVGDANMHEASILFGITSAQNSAENNLADTLHIMSVARKIDPVAYEDKFRQELREGRRPDGQKLKITGAQIDKIVGLYQEGTIEGGLKVTSYMQNIKDAALNLFSPHTVQDVHMARVFGFNYRDVDKKTGNVVDMAKFPSESAIRYAQYQTMQLAEEYNLRPHEVQAYLWFYSKKNLAPTKEVKATAKVGAGTWESAKTYSAKEIAEAEAAIDKTKPISKVFIDPKDPGYKSKVISDPYSNTEFNDQLMELARKRAPKAVVSLVPGTERGLNFVEAEFADLRQYSRDVLEAITDDIGQIKILREMGIPHEIEEIVGTWDRMEPSFQIRLPGGNLEDARRVASLLGDAFLQDAAITAQPDFEGSDYGLVVRKLDDTNFTTVELDDIYNKVNVEHSVAGLNFSTTADGKGIKFIDNYFFDAEEYTGADFQAFYEQVKAALGDTYEIKGFSQKGDMYDTTNYEENNQRTFSAYGKQRGSDLQRAAQRNLYAPVKRVYERWYRKLEKRAEEKRPLASPVSLSRLKDPLAAQQEIYGRFGSLRPDADTTESLKIYDLDSLIENPEKIDALLNEYGFEVKYFSFHEDPAAGVEFTVPKLKKEPYSEGVLWIYDPRVAHGSFKDEQYTRSWRIVHELGHAITERIMQKRYGDSRREGRMGRTWNALRGHPAKKQVTVELDPLTLNHAQRAVEWEDVSFRVQRYLMEDMGITVSPVDFGREYNTNIADAIHRVLTGDFGDPGEYGFVPRETLPPLKGIMHMLESTEKTMAKEQGRQPTKGVNMAKWERFTEAQLRSEMKAQKKVTDARLSRGGKKGVTPQDLTNHIKQLTSRWKGAQNIAVVPDYTKLPTHLKNFVEQQNAQDDADGIFDTVTGNVYLIANNIKSTDQATKIIFHEVLGHGGLRAVFGDDIVPFLKNVYKAKKDDELMAKIIVDYGLDMRRPDDRVVAAEEWLAITQESLPKDTWVRQLVSFIRQWLRKLSPGLKVTDAEIHGALGRMRGQVINGGPMWRQAVEILPMFSRASDPFYSQMEVHLTAKLPGKGTAQSYADTIKAFVKKGQMKAEEVEWSGVLEWLEGQEGKVAKQDVLDYVAANKIELQEEFTDYIDGMEQLKRRFSVIEEGGRWYWYEAGEPMHQIYTGEHLWSHTEEEAWETIEHDYLDEDDIPGGTKYHGYQMGGGQNYREARLFLPPTGKLDYRSRHWDEPNIIAHVRMNERVDDLGNRVLFVEEVQSDWHQEGRKKGYDTPGRPKWQVYDPINATHETFTDVEKAKAFKKELQESGWAGRELAIRQIDPKVVPDAPFKTTWPLLAMKRMIRYAAENGFDKLAWTTGDVQVERFDLSKQLNKVSFTKDEGEVHLTAFDHDGNNVLGEVVAEDELSDYVGKDLADKIIAHKYPEGEFSGLDLKVGGAGMVKFYDTMLPSIVNKYTKKWGSKVEKVNVAGFDGVYPTNEQWWAAGYTGNPFETIVNIDDTVITVHNKFTGEEKDFPNRNLAHEYMDREMARMVAAPQHGITITEKMRDAAMQGQPLFSRGANRNNSERPEASDRFVQEIAEENDNTYKKWAKGVIDKMDRKINGFSELVDLSSYLEHRGRLQALIQQGQDTARSLYETFKDLSETESLNVFEYMTDRDALPSIIEDENIRREAIKAKRLINSMGLMLVNQGLIPSSSYQNYESRYLPRVYLAYLMGDKAIRALGTGKKLSKQGYAKKRSERLTKEYREVVLGEIKDPAFLMSRAIGIPSRDLAIMEFFEKIIQNPNWVLQDQLVEIQMPGTNVTREVTTYWLGMEAKRLRTMSAQLKESEQKTQMDNLASEYERLVAEAHVDERGFDVDEYKQIPDTPQYGILRGLVVKKAIFDDIAESGASLQDNPDAWMKLFGQGGPGTKITQLWKVMKVSLNPPSQIRNLVSNWVLLNLSGVPIHKMPYYLGRAAGELARGIRGQESRYYDIAKEFGITAGTFSANELAQIEKEFVDFRARNKGKLSIPGLLNMGSTIIEKAGNLYQHAEVLSKVAKIMHEIEVKGTDPALAAQEANKWLFDYSAVSEFIRTARNAPIGIPFLTFYMKVLPRLLEVAATAPWRFAPYYLMLKGMAVIAAAVNDVDDDDIERLKMAHPEWLRERGHAVIWPWKDDQGRWASTNLGYFFPWTAWTDLAQDFGEISKSVVTGEPFEARNILQGSGVFGSPLANLISASMTNIDPFTRKEIVRDGDLPYQQMLSRLNYMYSLMAPPWMTTGGPLAKIARAGSGYRDRWGNPQPTLAQSTARAVGVNIYPIEPERSRQVNLRFMKRDLDDIKSRMRFELKDPNLSVEERRKLREKYREQMRYMREKIKRYRELSKVHPKLK